MRVTDNLAEATASTRVGRELDLLELVEVIRSCKEVPSLDRIKKWLSMFVGRQRDYERFRVFTPRKYARNLILRSPHAELLLLCWRAGQRTPIHDHGGSVGVVRVCEGLLTETLFERGADGRVRPFNTFRWGPGSITGADIPDIHQLLNLQPDSRDLVTLHCYAPPLTVLNKYSQRSRRVGRWQEGYYFSGGGGI